MNIPDLFQAARLAETLSVDGVSMMLMVGQDGLLIAGYGVRNAQSSAVERSRYSHLLTPRQVEEWFYVDLERVVREVDYNVRRWIDEVKPS